MDPKGSLGESKEIQMHPAEVPGRAKKQVYSIGFKAPGGDGDHFGNPNESKWSQEDLFGDPKKSK